MSYDNSLPVFVTRKHEHPKMGIWRIVLHFLLKDPEIQFTFYLIYFNEISSYLFPF